MAKILIVSANPNNNLQNFGQTIFRAISGDTGIATAENDAKMPFRSNGTFSGMSTNVSTNTVNASTTFRFRKNAANGNQTFSVGSSATGQFQDLVNTDTVTAGDLVDYSTVSGGTSGTMSPQTTTFTFDTSTSTTLSSTRIAITNISGQDTYTGASTTYFQPICGYFPATTTSTEASSQVKMQYSGTFKNLAVRLQSNSRTTTTTIRLRKNGANGNLTVAFGSTVSGLLEDTSNSDAVTGGTDLICFSMVNGTGTLAIIYSFISVEFQNTTDPGLGLIALTNPLRGALGRTNTYYQQIGGFFDPTTSEPEAQSQIKVAEAWKFKGLAINAPVNGITSGNTTITLRKNGADTTLVASVTASTTGWFQDTTHSETVAVGDLVNYKIIIGTGSGTQTCTIAGMTMTTEMAGTVTTITMTPNAVTLRNKSILVV